MKITLDIANKTYTVDLKDGWDLSLAVSANGPRAWYVEPAEIKPVINESVIGSVELGGNVNFFDVRFNPHGHGTHTESKGHITPEKESVNTVLTRYFFLAQVVTVTPTMVEKEFGTTKKGDRMIVREQLEAVLKNFQGEALIIRTLPNIQEKRVMNYSDTNFPYFDAQALALMAECGVLHLLIDLPSVDRESDGGKLAGHRAFWNGDHRSGCTITEFIFVDDSIEDGLYLLNLQVAPFENDAAPSRPVLYRLVS